MEYMRIRKILKNESRNTEEDRKPWFKEDSIKL